MTASKDLSAEYTLLYGIAEKSVFEMTDAERKQAAAKAFERAKEAASKLLQPTPAAQTTTAATNTNTR